jgi:hypothetical protein
LGDAFSLITAFSREGAEKVYVQHRLAEHKKEVNELIKQGAYFYVCGDASHMAREVNATLGKILASERGLPEEQGHELVKRLRSSNLYQVRPRSHTHRTLSCLLTELSRRTSGHRRKKANSHHHFPCFIYEEALGGFDTYIDRLLGQNYGFFLLLLPCFFPP